MLKRTCIFMLTVLVLLSGCTQNAQPETCSHPEKSSVPEHDLEENLPEEIKYLKENFPKIDGSTSLIPLEAAVRAAIFGKTVEEVENDVFHTTTWTAFSRLLNGEVDMILTCELSEDQYKMAEDVGAEIELVPVAMEGFVFVVNAENPVDSITQEQLRKIYSGEITNWKELGGNDAEIIAYQRNYNSGSQNFMIDFMGDTPLMDAPTEKRPGSMSGLMDVIAVSDNSENSIGYSVYAYAANMYGNGNEIKFIKVDGVAPSKTTMSAGEYPLLGRNYAAFLKSQSENSPARALANWMASDEGQFTAAGAGYVTVRDVGFVYDEVGLEKFEAVGAGIRRPEVELPSYEYIVKAEVINPNAVIEKIADAALREEVNAFITEAKNIISGKKTSLANFISEKTASGGEGELYTLGIAEYGTYGSDKAAVIVSAKNGYLSVAVTLGYTYNPMDGYAHFYRMETAIWDMFTGERVGVEDLFYDGVDIDSVLSEYLRKKSVERVGAYYSYQLKKDFSILEKDGLSFTHDAVYLDFGNPHFVEGVRIELEDLPYGFMVTEQPRDMTECFEENSGLVKKLFRTTGRNAEYKYLESRGEEYPMAYALLNENSYSTAKQINSVVEKYLNEYYTEDAILGYYESLGYNSEELLEDGILYWNDWSMEEYGGKYAIFLSSVPWYTDWTNNNYPKDIPYPYAKAFVFDIETGEEIGFEGMLKGNWKEELRFNPSNGTTYSAYKNPETLIFRGMDEYRGEYKIILLSSETGDSFSVDVPEEYINW